VRRCLLPLLVAGCAASRVAVRSPPPALVGRRAAIERAALLFSAVPLASALPAEAASVESNRAKIKETAADLHKLLDNKDSFIAALAAGDSESAVLPPAVPFTVFQSLEKTAEPEFMEIAIDYMEAARNARDLYKLAKLSKSTVEVSVKEPGKPRKVEFKEYGEAGGLGSSAKEYAERSVQEVVGASVALDAVVDAMVARK